MGLLPLSCHGTIENGSQSVKNRFVALVVHALLRKVDCISATGMRPGADLQREQACFDGQFPREFDEPRSRLQCFWAVG